MSTSRIEVTEPEYFAFNFIGNHPGKGIPMPLPQTVRALEKKGLIAFGELLPVDRKTRCWLTHLGKVCFKPQ